MDFYTQSILKQHVLLLEGLIHVTHLTSIRIYSSGEMGISRFSLQNGEIQRYHTLIDPGTIPAGYFIF